MQPRGRQPIMSAILDTDQPSRSKRPSNRNSSLPTTPRKMAKPISPTPSSPIQEVTPSGIGSYQKASIPSSGSDLLTVYQGELTQLTQYRTSWRKQLKKKKKKKKKKKNV